MVALSNYKSAVLLAELRGVELANLRVWTEATLYSSACRAVPSFITAGTVRVLRFVTLWSICDESQAATLTERFANARQLSVANAVVRVSEPS